MSPPRPSNSATVGPGRDNAGVTTSDLCRYRGSPLDALNRSSSADVTSVTSCASHVRSLPGSAGSRTAWPHWVPAAVGDAFGSIGIAQPWTHQALAADLVHRGTDVVLATGTASGKSLGYQLPALSAIVADPRTSVLYLAPTKALAADQLDDLHSLAVPGLRPTTYDGDTPEEERDWARGHANWLLTNPDMLHLGLLPHHSGLARFWRRLAFVVIDECHAYRGVFGSHVALVLRRLLRVARLYKADPVCVLASATSAAPAAAAARLIGRPVRAITQDGSARPATDFVLWEPSAGGDDGRPAGDGSTAPTPLTRPHGAGIGGGGSIDDVDDRTAARRPSAHAEAARLLADLVAGGARTLTFVRSRQAAEQVALAARRRLHRIAPALAPRVAAYRGGYLPEDRRELERALNSGELLGLASTNALELGIDIAGLDAAVIAGYPGTLAALWQQAGRAGRGGAV
ncbi:MAG TPA: DEAD/DEAH box helicase, partial [Actinomycetota bacterium]|nr:DEAD/DEAH box helicase [Actinomycetota bacterium]